VYLTDTGLTFSATDLSNFLACPHLSVLNRAMVYGGPKPPVYDDPALEALRRRGLEHEDAYRRGLEAAGLNVRSIEDPTDLPISRRRAVHAAATLDAMREGVDVIFQGALLEGAWFGKPDFLRKVAKPSAFGPWSYEVVDTKLAREAKGGALLQVLLYADMLERAQGSAPEFVHLVLGGPESPEESFRVADYAAYFRLVRTRFLRHANAGDDHDQEHIPDPVEHCGICAWGSRCDTVRRGVDHLSLVAGISRRQRDALVQREVATVVALSGLGLPFTPPLDGVGIASLERVREQARIQVEGRLAGEPRHELILPIVPGEGLAALPAPSPGDLFLDLEGNPYALTYGLEYLFGFVEPDGKYTGWWALDRETEKAAFERFIDLAMERFAAYPDMHIYHFAPYEPTAFRRLMGFHATRETEVDQLLRGEVFVDLHRVVRQGIRASVESYSIKKLEPFYGFHREVDLRKASLALGRFDAMLEVGLYEEDRESLAREVEGYNQDDCVSTLRLYQWLEGRRVALEQQLGEPIPRPSVEKGEESEERNKRRVEVEERMNALLAGVPADPDARSPEQQSAWLLAQMLEFYRREKKALWWEYFRSLDLSHEERIDDRGTLGGLEYEGEVGTVARSTIHRYRYPPQEHSIREGTTVIDPDTEKAPGKVDAVDSVAGTIDLVRSNRSTVPHPRSLVPKDDINEGVLQKSLLRVADAVIEHGFGEGNPYLAAADLLLRRRPRAGQAEGEMLLRAGEDSLEGGRRLVTNLRRTVLPIQGPPGSGKTYTAARMIVRALAEGKRVGVTGPSHKVIGNLLSEVCKAAAEAGQSFRGVQKANEEQGCGGREIEAIDNNEAVLSELQSGNAQLAAGTAWFWSREDVVGSVDILFVDEAGQFSLANTLAVAPAATDLVLSGDPRQLEQPLQGVHPPGAEASALDHLLAGEPTVAPDRGIFLATTWRLHPTICRFTSEVYYEGRLHPREGLDRQTVRGSGSVQGSGLRLVSVPHSGNQNDSPEEIEAITRLVDTLLDGRSVWTDSAGTEHPLTLPDILVVAPYNAQVAALARSLPPGARVGTVDKFQGQEAPIVIYSVTTSSAVEAPRGMDFLYSPNRLNVATSRAKCLAVLVASPEVFLPESRTPKQMRLANGLCRFRELAEDVDSGGNGEAGDDAGRRMGHR